MHIFHKWKFWNSQTGKTYSSLSTIPVDHWTQVMYKCFCGKRKVVRYDGIWEDKDFQ